MKPATASRTCFSIVMTIFWTVSLVHAQNAPELSGIPGPLTWHNTPAETYIFNTRVQVRFTSKWDAGALMLWADDHNWAKLSFELSPDKKPTLVTVVTRGVSDDCNSVAISGAAVWLQIARTGQTYVFYYSVDGSSWHILRTFNLATTASVFLGFESQSPAGAGSSATFSRIHYSQRKIANIYTGK